MKKAMNQSGFALSVLDQLPFFRTYTQMLLCFPVAADIKRSEIIQTLQSAAAALVQAVPILAGQVVNHKDENLQVPNSGTFRVEPYDHPNGSPIRINVLDDFVSYDQLRDSKAPASLLDGALVAPMKGYPDHCGDADVTPVLVIQANLIPRGLLLCFAGMHNCMDGTGLGQVIRLFASLCRGKALSTADLEAVNMDRSQLPVSLKPGQSPMLHPEMTPNSDAAHKDDAKDAPASVWSYLSIPPSKLKALKQEVSEELTSGWVSTNDVATAWLWKAVTKARHSHIDAEQGTTLIRAVTGRRVLEPPLPESYTGNNVMRASSKMPVKDLVDLPLVKIAQAVRRATSAVDDHYVRSIATLVRKEPDRNKITFSVEAPDRDFMVSSWASVPAYGDFGNVLGTPEFVRRPTSPPWTGVCYIMPKHPNGSFEMLLSLREDDMLRLRNDQEFAAVAEYIG
ncbi:MAG: hypothetical protein LQ346_007594 [Caloplaca aetnensis]|nr:MAG: hypothetical protein LQ346_007594 [Caloplaca aetnensis]